MKRPGRRYHRHIPGLTLTDRMRIYVMADKALPCPQVLRQLMSYNPQTGKLFWKERGAEWFTDGTYHTAEVQAQIWNTKYAGKEAFTPLNSCRYHTGAVLGKILLAHRIAWAITHGRWPNHFLDHINGIRSDNRLCNLREATNAENLRNRGVQKDSESGIKGVRFDRRYGRWQARITVERRQKHLGYYDTPEAAAAAYAEAARRHHGEFARTA